MGVAVQLLTELARSSKRKEYSTVASQLRRSMQAWGVSHNPKESLEDEDIAIINRFWRKLYSLDERTLRKEAVRLFALCIAADTEYYFTPLTCMAANECERLAKACDELLEELSCARKVVCLHKGGPQLSVITNQSLTPK